MFSGGSAPGRAKKRSALALHDRVRRTPGSVGPDAVQVGHAQVLDHDLLLRLQIIDEQTTLLAVFLDLRLFLLAVVATDAGGVVDLGRLRGSNAREPEKNRRCGDAPKKATEDPAGVNEEGSDTRVHVCFLSVFLLCTCMMPNSTMVPLR